MIGANYSQESRPGVAVVTVASSGIGRTGVLQSAGWFRGGLPRRRRRPGGPTASPPWPPILGPTPIQPSVFSGYFHLLLPTSRPYHDVTCDRRADHAVVEHSGGAARARPIGQANVDDWQWITNVNVLGTLRVDQGRCCPTSTPAGRDVVVDEPPPPASSRTRARGYAAAKHAQPRWPITLVRLELSSGPSGSIGSIPDGAHGGVRALLRLRRAEPGPTRCTGLVGANTLVADAFAECVTWSATLPHHSTLTGWWVLHWLRAARHQVHLVGDLTVVAALSELSGAAIRERRRQKEH